MAPNGFSKLSTRNWAYRFYLHFAYANSESDPSHRASILKKAKGPKNIAWREANMSFKKKFLSDIKKTESQRFKNSGNRPVIEIWPDDDSDWVMSHEDQVRQVLCATPEFESTPFCGKGLHWHPRVHGGNLELHSEILKRRSGLMDIVIFPLIHFLCEIKTGISTAFVLDSRAYSKT